MGMGLINRGVRVRVRVGVYAPSGASPLPPTRLRVAAVSAKRRFDAAQRFMVPAAIAEADTAQGLRKTPGQLRERIRRSHLQGDG